MVCKLGVGSRMFVVRGCHRVFSLETRRGHRMHVRRIQIKTLQASWLTDQSLPWSSTIPIHSKDMSLQEGSTHRMAPTSVGTSVSSTFEAYWNQLHVLSHPQPTPGSPCSGNQVQRPFHTKVSCSFTCYLAQCPLADPSHLSSVCQSTRRAALVWKGLEVCVCQPCDFFQQVKKQLHTASIACRDWIEKWHSLFTTELQNTVLSPISVTLQSQDGRKAKRRATTFRRVIRRDGDYMMFN